MNTINEIIGTNFNLNQDKVLENLAMKDVSNWDSLTHMKLIVTIEEAFNIELDGDDIAEMTSFDSIRSILSKYVSE